MLARLNVKSFAVLAVSSISALINGASAELASWFGHRVALVRDSIYIEGGVLTEGNFSDGAWSRTSIRSSSGGGVLAVLDLTVGFTTSDYSRALHFLNESNDGNDPGYIHGGGFATDNGFMTFGGQRNSLRNSTYLNSLKFFRYNNTKTAFISPVSFQDGSASVYQNITAANSVSIPGQDSGFYLGGMSTANYSTLRYPLPPNFGSIMQPSSSFYQWNLTDSQNPQVVALNLSITSRAQGELIWLPIGKKGALVLIGGVQYPADLFAAKNPLSTDDNTFMTEIQIYDIENDRWYAHSVKGDDNVPSQTAAFCAVAAVAPDRSSYNIYIYGGYTGTSSLAQPASDTVWILSLPAFQYIAVPASQSIHGRKSHRCLKPYPNQMITIGGSQLSSAPLGTPSMLDVFDLNTLNWTGKYDPLVWAEYQVPKRVSAKIGGNEQGHARIADHLNALPPDLATLFKTPYQGNIPKHYPYARKNVRFYIRKVPGWLQLVIGILTYLLVLSLAFVCVMLMRQRKLLKNAGLEGKDLGPGHATITRLDKKFRKHPQKYEKVEPADTKLKPLSLLHIDQDKTEVYTYTDDESDMRTVRTRTSGRSDQRLLSEEFEMDMMLTLQRSRL